MKDKTISARQTGILCFIVLLANKIFLLPSLLHSTVKADGVFVMLILFALELLVLGVFFLLKSKYPNDTFKTILEKHLGKVIAGIIYAIFMFFFIFKFMLTYAVTYTYMKALVYQTEFAFLALLCVIPIVNHAVLCGARAFARTAELFFYLIVAGVLMCIFVGVLDIQHVPLFFVSEGGEFASAIFRHFFSFGDLLFLFLIIDKVKIEKGEGKKIWGFAIFGITCVLAIFFVFYSIYPNTAFMHSNALTDILSVTIQFSVVGRLDVIAMITIIFLAYMQLSVFAYSFSAAFCDFFQKLNKSFSVAAFDLLFFTLYFVLVGRDETMVLYTISWLPYVAIVTNYLIPIILFFIALPSKKEVKYEKKF